MTLYTNVSKNKFNSFVLLTVFLLVVIGVAFVLGQAYDIVWLLPVAVVVSSIQAWLSYYYSDQIALAVAHAQPLSKSTYPQVYRLVENLTITAGLPQPKLYLIDDSAPNAFACGRDPEHASIAITLGLLDKLDKSELEGVLAHELSHIGNYDIRFLTMVVVLVGIITMLSDWAMRISWYRGGGHGSREGGQGQLVIMILGLIMAMLAPLVATLIQLAISRKREFLADSTGALLTRYPQGLALALSKIASDQEPLEVANKATAHLYVSNPLKTKGRSQSWLAKMFSTHPPVEERVAALMKGSGQPEIPGA